MTPELTEEAIFEQAFGASSDLEEPAADDTAAVLDLNPDDAHTGSTEDAAAEPVDEAPEAENAEDAEPASDDAAADTSDQPNDDQDSFQDLLDPIPTAEDLLKRHTRIPQTAKDEMVKLADNWRNDRQKLERIGGDLGVTALEPVVKLLGNANPTSQEALEAFDVMLQTNREATLTGILESAVVLLDSPTPEFKILGDALMQKTFGQGVTTQHVKDLLTLERAGMVNIEEDMQLLGNSDTSSSLFAKQQETIKKLERQLEETNELLNDPDKLAARTGKTKQAEAVFEADFNDRVTDAVKPFLEKGRWDTGSALAKHVLPGILAGLSREPEYQAAKTFIASQKGYSADKAPFAVQQAINTLMSKAKARVAQAIKEVNAELKTTSTVSRNAVVKEQVKETRPKSESLAATAKVGSGYATSAAGTVDEAEDALFRKVLGGFN